MTFYEGPVWASHNNCRTFVDHNRQFSDEQLSELINRKAVIGMALDAWMMVPNWQRGVSNPTNTNVTLAHTIQNIDHICQLAGNSLHVGIGTDLDGGFGTEQGPSDVDTIADLQKIPQMLIDKGYTPRDKKNIMHGNFVRFLTDTWQ
jgi:membrane dipeptidase